MTILRLIAILIREALNKRERIINKNISSGYAGLDANLKILESALPTMLEPQKSNNRYYSSPCTSAALTTATLAANTLYAMPLIVNRKTKFDNIIINVTTIGVGSSIRVGIYNDVNLYPQNLIVDAGIQSSATTGVKNYSIAITLESGVYWLVCVSNATAPIIRGFNANALIPVLGFDNLLNAASGLCYLRAFTFAALPASFPTGATIRTTTPLPMIGIRAIL